MMKMPARLSTSYNIATDSRKKLVFRINGGFNMGFSESSSTIRIGGSATYKPTDNLVLTLNPAYSVSENELQYVTRRLFNGEDRYIFGTIDQKILSMSFRLNFNLTPDLTLQYWGQPFIACGSYSEFKKITVNPLASDYYDRFEIYPEERIELVDNSYRVDEDGNGTTDYSFGNPDFNTQEFLSNLVIRWEYNPGSSVYLVWSQTRYNSDPTAGFAPDDNFSDLFSSDPYNVFLVKFSFRFGMK